MFDSRVFTFAYRRVLSEDETVNAYYARLTSATLALCLAAGPVMAQDGPEQEKRVRRATRQMWLGSGMMGGLSETSGGSGSFKSGAR